MNKNDTCITCSNKIKYSCEQLNYCCCDFKNTSDHNQIFKYCKKCMVLNGGNIFFKKKCFFNNIDLCKYCNVYHQIKLLTHLIKKDNTHEEKRRELIDELVQYQIDIKIYNNPGGIDTKACDECNEWDGESRRCECGNRRIDWEYDEPKYSECPNIYLYPEAY